jgi:hypothetical protein
MLGAVSRILRHNPPQTLPDASAFHFFSSSRSGDFISELPIFYATSLKHLLQDGVARIHIVVNATLPRVLAMQPSSILFYFSFKRDRQQQELSSFLGSEWPSALSPGQKRREILHQPKLPYLEQSSIINVRAVELEDE